jgi:hypothetical protein
LRNNPPDTDDFFALEEFPELAGAMSRPLWQTPEELTMPGDVEVADETVRREDLERLRNLPQIRLHELRKNVEQALREVPTMTLEQVLDRFPPRYGMLEVIGYMIVALDNSKHYIGEEMQTILVPFPKPTRWNVPAILFCQ